MDKQERIFEKILLIDRVLFYLLVFTIANLFLALAILLFQL